MKKSVKKMYEKLIKDAEIVNKNQKEREKRLQKFYDIMNENISNNEKLEKIYKKQLNTIFEFGKVESRKKGRKIFKITDEVKFDKHKVFDELAGLEYEICGDC